MATLIATSVLRAPRGGQVREGVFLVDLDRRRVAEVFDRQVPGAARALPGKDRALRGIAFDRERLFIASSDELLVFSPRFESLGSYQCPYLQDCEEISVHRRRLYLTSAGYDSILGFDLDQMRFSFGLHIAADGEGFRALPFDPGGQKGPRFADNLHLDSIHCNDQGMFVSGRHTGGLMRYGGRNIDRYASLPKGTHNARPWRGGVLFNDTEAGVVRYVNAERNHVFALPRHPKKEPDGNNTGAARRARSAIARGLCTLDENVFASGSSPSTITLHDLETMQTTLTINLSPDPRSAIHGLEVWPKEWVSD